jgi:hypothetical protein
MAGIIPVKIAAAQGRCEEDRRHGGRGRTPGWLK